MGKRTRKTLIPLLALTLLSWLLWGALAYLVEPGLVRDLVVPGSYLPFFLLAFSSSFFSGVLFFNNSRRGFLFSLCVIVFLLLRLMRLGNVVNVLLLVILVVVVEIYFSS